ncbi:GNAT family N-acetyltransferase, partial [candidate division GN15 bacterium]|nr:GNAT family N-acetyltransferase [candidate division GN15 bacterium]
KRISSSAALQQGNWRPNVGSPNLRTDRICLRFLRKRDVPSLTKHIRRKQVARYTLIPHPYTEKDGYKFLELSRKQLRNGTGYHLSIEDRATGEIIGGIGLNSLNRRHNNAEVGYWLSPDYHGRGIMVEALKLALRHFFRRFGFERIHAHVDINNIPSIKVLERSGFTREGCLRRAIKNHGRYRTIYMYGLLKNELRR